MDSMPILRKLRKRGDDEEMTEETPKHSGNVVKGKGKITTQPSDESENDYVESIYQKSNQSASVVKYKVGATNKACDASENESINLAINSFKTERSRRGPTQMEKLQKQRLQGIKKDVMFNTYGQPIGEAGVEMQSYIGVLAREKVNITYKSWKHVPRDVKESIWESVTLTFNVDPKWKEECFKSANDKWRTYKTHLTQTIVLKYKDDPEMLKTPPDGIQPSDWSAFVSNRTSEDFVKLSAKQREIALKNKIHYRGSRKGYAGLAEKIKHELCDDEEVDRAIIWKKARLNKEGEYEGLELVEAVDKIDDYIRQKTEGVLKLAGSTEDSPPLGIIKNDSRASLITPKVIVNCSAGKTITERGIKKYKKEEMNELKETISQQGARIAKLENVVIQLLSRAIINDRGGCLEKSSTSEDENSFSENEESDDDMQVIDKDDDLEGKVVALKLDSSNTVVANGTIVSTYKPGSKLHGAPFPENCMRVCIDKAVDALSPLPFPIPFECENVGDAVGMHVAWPEDLIMTRNKKPKKKRFSQATKLVAPKNMPTSLKMLYCYCKVSLEDGMGISMRLDDDLFNEKCELNVHLEDIIPFCELQPISCNCIVAYVWLLYKKMKEENKLERFRFVNPHSIPHEPTTRTETDWIAERLNTKARVLADRLIGTTPSQLVLVPCNIGFHWILSVIDPYKEVVYTLDPLGLKAHNSDWKFVVDKAIKLFNTSKKRKGKKQPKWNIVQGPRQPGSTQCGFYVMRYMREIIEEATTMDSLLLIFENKRYSEKEIDEVRSEWAECIQEHIK